MIMISQFGRYFFYERQSIIWISTQFNFAFHNQPAFQTFQTDLWSTVLGLDTVSKVTIHMSVQSEDTLT